VGYGHRAALLALLCAGCAPKLEPVEVDYRRITIEHMTEAMVELWIDNPNSFAVDLEALDYRILLTRDTFASGKRPEPVSIRARDTTLASFPFSIRMDLSQVISHVPELAGDTVYLELEGRYSFPGPLGRLKRPFRYRRMIPLGRELEELAEPLRDLFGE